RNAREVGEQIQQWPLANEHVASGASQLGNNCTGRDGVAVGDLRGPLDHSVHFVDQHGRGAQASDHAWLTRDDGCRALSISIHDGQRGPIVLTVQILAHREPDDLLQIVFDRRIPVELVEVRWHLRYWLAITCIMLACRSLESLVGAAAGESKPSTTYDPF